MLTSVSSSSFQLTSSINVLAVGGMESLPGVVLPLIAPNCVLPEVLGELGEYRDPGAWCASRTSGGVRRDCGPRMRASSIAGRATRTLASDAGARTRGRRSRDSRVAEPS